MRTQCNFQWWVLEDVLGLGLEAYKFSKMSCPWLKDSIIFWLLKKENNQAKNNLSAIVCQFVASFLYLKNNKMCLPFKPLKLFLMTLLYCK